MKVCVHHGSSPSPGHRIQTLRPELKALNSWGLGTFLSMWLQSCLEAPTELGSLLQRGLMQVLCENCLGCVLSGILMLRLLRVL